MAGCGSRRRSAGYSAETNISDAREQVPSAWKHVAETSSLWARGWRQFGHLGPRGPEDGPPALVIPGFVANDRTTMQLRRALAEANWRVHGWDAGWNLGARANTLELLKRRLDAIAPDRPVLLVGWSLGGVFARELARMEPERVRAVVTLASPFSGDPRLNNVWKFYERVAGHPVDAPPIARICDKPPVPTLAIWGQRDGLLAERAACGLPHESDFQLGLPCNHMDFAASRRATRTVVREIDIFLKTVA